MSEHYRGPAESPRCHECPCARDGKAYRPIRGAGVPGKLAIVGEGPSTEEVHQGWPFVGPSGKLLQQVFNEHNIDRHDIWITNAILCQRLYKPEALAKAIDCCRPRLEAELHAVNPTAVCALGASAATSMQLAVDTITDARGTIQASSLVSAAIPVVTTIHPAAILRGGAGEIKGGGQQKMNIDAQYVFLSADVGKAYKLANNAAGVMWTDDIKLIVAESDDAIEFVNSVYTAQIIAIDLEWGKDGIITWLGIATEEHAISVYLPHASMALKHRLYLLGKSNTPKLFHNLQADVKVWEQQIGPINGVLEDTMLMHHASYPGAAHDLQNVTSQFLNVPPWKALRRGEEKQAKKDATKRKREEVKALRKAQHQAHNAELHAGAVERKRVRKAKTVNEPSMSDLLGLIGKDESK